MYMYIHVCAIMFLAAALPLTDCVGLFVTHMHVHVGVHVCIATANIGHQVYIGQVVYDIHSLLQ